MVCRLVYRSTIDIVHTVLQQPCRPAKPDFSGIFSGAVDKPGKQL